MKDRPFFFFWCTEEILSFPYPANQGNEGKGTQIIEVLLWSSFRSYSGILAVVQWVKNPAAAALGTVESWVLLPAQCTGLKDPALSLLQHRSQVQLRFSSWPGNFCMPWMWPKKKKKLFNHRMLIDFIKVCELFQQTLIRHLLDIGLVLASRDNNDLQSLFSSKA